MPSLLIVGCSSCHARLPVIGPRTGLAACARGKRRRGKGTRHTGVDQAWAASVSAVRQAATAGLLWTWDRTAYNVRCRAGRSGTDVTVGGARTTAMLGMSATADRLAMTANWVEKPLTV